MDLDAYREAMRRLRPPQRSSRQGADLPRDPDADHLPEGLEELEGRPVTITGIDRDTGELVQGSGTLTTVPGLSGDLHRREP
jgi:hypothetical protein